MTPLPKEIEKMIEEYADYLCPDDKCSHEAVSTDTYGFIARLLDVYCLVSKEKVRREYDLAKRRIADGRSAGKPGVTCLGLGGRITLESLFDLPTLKGE